MKRNSHLHSELKLHKVQVSQSSVLGSILYRLHTSDIHGLEWNTTAIFVDNTKIIVTGENKKEAAIKLHMPFDRINPSKRPCDVKLNKNKSIHLDFTNKKKQYMSIRIKDA